ncbi:hypothetical protein BBM60_15310 [Vibrio parahaemolyticus]|nr:hypothetical protein [Vibrio parahaemolyticus]OEA29011.1 hypothetical protein BBM58_14345 [Vibrio parahaemolyticus]OEA37182.1 hypothetical protein BBM60_15310 [Vibrio parahaemolyticus]OEB29592.1 hypothetical protein BBM76_01935 [Vibrio parahaemolyticus]OEB74120.1 hypothetical protein BBM85_17170 [Vibrio parahaemolyticus]
MLCCIVVPKGLFGVQIRFYGVEIPSGFSDRRFETAPDLSPSKYEVLVLAKLQSTSNQSFKFGN